MHLNNKSPLNKASSGFTKESHYPQSQWRLSASTLARYQWTSCFSSQFFFKFTILGGKWGQTCLKLLPVILYSWENTFCGAVMESRRWRSKNVCQCWLINVICFLAQTKPFLLILSTQSIFPHSSTIVKIPVRCFINVFLLKETNLYPLFEYRWYPDF